MNTDSESSRRDLYNGSVKTRFKAIFKIVKFRFCSLVYMNFATKLRFLWIFAPGGLLSYEALQIQNTSKLIKLNDLIANLVNDSLKYLITWLNIYIASP